ncbi:MAG TPA: alanine racemase [Chloroflexia bacterium]|jgi:alanine racemase
MVSLGDEVKAASTFETLGRPLVAEIDLSAIAGNTRAIKSLVGPRCRVLAVVKAVGYGLGAQWVAQAALEGGASWLGVACVDEGVQLRRAGYTGPVLIMSYTPPEEAELAARNRLTLAVHREHTARALEAAARSLGLSPREVAVHVKVDTGLGRFGCLPEELLPLVRAIGKLPHLRLEGLMTHFADADNRDLTFARRQLSVLKDLEALAAEDGIKFEIVHAANSAATLCMPEARLDMVRCGILLSGHLPAPHMAGMLELKQALTLRSKLARVFQVEAGATVGYGRTWTAKAPALIGLVTIGYADGYRRVLSGRAEALVGGRRVPLVGRVSMDQVGLDLTHVPDAREGDEVVLVGSQVGASVTVDDLARWADTISYEILCGLSERVPRRYMHSGEAVEVCNLLGCSPAKDRNGARKELSR